MPGGDGMLAVDHGDDGARDRRMPRAIDLPLAADDLAPARVVTQARQPGVHGDEPDAAIDGRVRGRRAAA